MVAIFTGPRQPVLKIVDRVRVAPDTGQRPVAGSARTRHTTGPVQAGPNPWRHRLPDTVTQNHIAPRDRRRDKIPIAAQRRGIARYRRNGA